MAAPAPTDPTAPPDPVRGTVTAALQQLQHAKGWLTDRDLIELAEHLGVPTYRVEEVVSFFPHFRREKPPLVELRVCRDMTCHLRGAARMTAELADRFKDEPSVAVVPVSCLGRCDRAPAACLDRFGTLHGQPGADVTDALYLGRDVDELTDVVSAAWHNEPLPTPDRDADLPPPARPWQIDVYNGQPTFEAARNYLREIRQSDNPSEARGRIDVIAKLKVAGLRGMGGAGAPAAKKWEDVARASGSEKYIVCNADESEPGTFKDREIMLRAPHLVVEGIILAGLALGATRGYVYIRHEYPEQAAAVRMAIAAAEKLGVCGRNLRGTGIDFPVSVFISPGGYICGEQSALIEAMEGKRAQPRNRPPELATNGLFDKPTLVNNVETFAWVPGIALKTSLGPEKVVNWYGSKGPNNRGMRFFSISGDVNRPGAYEMPIGAQFGELLEAAGGVIGGEENLLSVASSGPSGGFLPARALRDVKAAKDPRGTFRSRNLLEIELDIDEFRKLGGALGAGIVVYAQGTDMTSMAVNATEFYRNESCGKCVPCRVGSQKLVELGLRLKTDTRPQIVQAVRAAVRDLDKALEQTSICGLGQVAPKPLLTLLRYFRPADASADWSMMSMPAIVLPDRPTRK